MADAEIARFATAESSPDAKDNRGTPHEVRNLFDLCNELARVRRLAVASALACSGLDPHDPEANAVSELARLVADEVEGIEEAADRLWRARRVQPTAA